MHVNKRVKVIPALITRTNPIGENRGIALELESVSLSKEFSLNRKENLKVKLSEFL